MPSLLLTTCEAWPNLPENLIPLVTTLEQQGVQVRVAPWQDTSKADIVLPICAWDYATQEQLFSAWLTSLEAQRILTANPIPLMRWNMHKTYLCDLAQAGIAVIPTQFLLPQVVTHTHHTIQQWYSHLDSPSWWHQGMAGMTREIVIKPAVGQSGQAVAKCALDALPQDLSRYSQGLIVQPYIAAIERYGETSMIFLNGKFSHAVKRQPPQGEWRANSAYGVEVFSTQPSAIALRTAQQVMEFLRELSLPKHTPSVPVYARIDGIDALEEQAFLVNECELIEPALYLHTHQLATTQLATLLMQKLEAMS